jgi:uncharacterized iron-regulated membrane protein
MIRWLDNPRATVLRRVMFWAHLVCGLLIGVALSAVSLTGSALIFRPEIEAALYRPVVQPLAQRASLDDIISGIVAQHPDRRLSRMQLPADETQALEVVLSRRGARSLKDAQQLSVFVDPFSGRTLAEHEKQSSLIFLLQELHFSLLAGLPGLTINGVMSLLLVVMCVSGIAIWWPGRLRWRNGFRIQWNASWKRVTWDLHGVAGFFSAAALLLFGVTGVYYGFRGPVTRLLHAVTRSAPTAAAPKVRPGGTVASLDSVVRSARGAIPGARVGALRFPASTTSPWVASASVRNHTSEGEDRIYLDAGGRVLRVDRPSEFPVGPRLIELINPLHFGTIGGNVTRWLWLVIGFIPPLLFATGFLLWWNRVVVPRTRTTTLSSAS